MFFYFFFIHISRRLHNKRITCGINSIIIKCVICFLVDQLQIHSKVVQKFLSLLCVLYQYELQHILWVHPYPLCPRKTASFDQPQNTNTEKQEEKFGRNCTIFCGRHLKYRGVRGVWRHIMYQRFKKIVTLKGGTAECRNGGTVENQPKS